MHAFCAESAWPAQRLTGLGEPRKCGRTICSPLSTFSSAVFCYGRHWGVDLSETEPLLGQRRDHVPLRLAHRDSLSEPLSPIPNEFVQNGNFGAGVHVADLRTGCKEQPDQNSHESADEALGEASYAVYILQVPIFVSAAANFRLFGADADRFPLLSFAVSFALLIMGSLLVSKIAKQSVHDRIARWSSSGPRVIETTGS